MIKPSLRVLQLFRQYLPPTGVWAFTLVQNLPDVEIVVGATEFIQGDLSSDTTRHVRFPLLFRENLSASLAAGTGRFALTLLAKVYARYLRFCCGRCDLVHSHFAPCGWAFRKLVREMGVPHVVSFYGYDYEKLPFCWPGWKKRYHTLFNTVDMFLCEGANGARILQEAGCPPRKIRIARLGVEVERISFVRRPKEAGELRLVQVAAFAEKKGYGDTVAAFLHCFERCPHMSLTLVGDDRDGTRRSIEEMVAAAGAGDRISFKKGVAYEDLPRLLEAYHVFIHPSHYSRDRDCEGGAPTVLLDAQATGMPVISTRHCDIPEEVVDGRSGLLCSERDPTALSDCIRRFYSMDQTAYNRYAMSARAHIEHYYDIRKNAARISGLYRELIRRKDPCWNRR